MNEGKKRFLERAKRCGVLRRTFEGARPLMSEEEYRAAMSEIESLMEAELGTPEGERLNGLVSSVEEYEAKPPQEALPAVSKDKP